MRLVRVYFILGLLVRTSPNKISVWTNLHLVVYATATKNWPTVVDHSGSGLLHTDRLLLSFDGQSVGERSHHPNSSLLEFGQAI